ncbi:hypothetical protein GGR56DRAFT_649140 [Xylariaceae sp. FL0804]|nr:hypothetical protein GGR56DRAFT_649140 [Xylariaceae sp. FL0804]
MPASTGVDIRLLASHRPRSSEAARGDHANKAAVAQATDAHRNGTGAAPRTKRRPFSRKKTPAPIIVTSSLTHDDILDDSRPLPPLPSTTPRTPRSITPRSTTPRSLTPRSSASVPCSCRQRANSQCSSPSCRRRSRLCSVSSKETAQSGRSSATSYGSGLNSPRRHSRVRVASPKSPSKRQAESWDWMPKLGGALSPKMQDKASKSSESLLLTTRFGSLSENALQLIQETDEAFKAVGNALAEVKLAGLGSPYQGESCPATPDISPILKRSPPPSPPRTSSSSYTINLNKPLPNIKLTPEPKSKRVSSVRKSRRPRSKYTAKMKPHRRPATPKTPGTPKSVVRSGPRWTLSENVSELLTGRFFHKIEADELLSPGQIEAFRIRHTPQQHALVSTETLNTDHADTPTEPFHLHDLPFRIGSAGVVVGAESSSEGGRLSALPAGLGGGRLSPLPSSTPKNDVASGDNSQAGDVKPEQSPLETDAVGAAEPIIRNSSATFPVQVVQQPARVMSRRPVRELPSIPEGVPVSSPGGDSFGGHTADASYEDSANPDHLFESVANSDYIFLQSSPRSINLPTVRHGPIRLAKADMSPELKQADDLDWTVGLDWTAFQMAISGGAGPCWAPEADDAADQSDLEDIADLMEWWDSYDFESPGGLVGGGLDDMPSPPSSASGDEFSDVDTSCSEIEGEVDSPYSHHDWQYLDPQQAPTGHGHGHVEANLVPENSSIHLLKEQLAIQACPPPPESEEKQCVAVERPALSSLPQSPMLDLRVIRGEKGGDDVDVIPMGYNLGHDLGDFLRWEAEHAYAGDFY